MKPVLLLAAMLLIVSSGCDNTDPVSEISLGTMPNVEISEFATTVLRGEGRTETRLSPT